MQRRGGSRTRGTLAARPFESQNKHSKGSTMSGGWRAAGQGSKAKHGVSTAVAKYRCCRWCAASGSLQRAALLP